MKKLSFDMAVYKGKRDKPVVVFIHGLGMDKNIWVDTLNTKIFAKSVPAKIFTAIKPKPCKCLKGRKITLGEYPGNIKPLWTALRDEGFNLICWSQRSPAGPISEAVSELSEIIKWTKEHFPKTPIALIGHSRGGLIARKFMERKREGVKALVTVSTPHAGSSIARLGKYLKPFSIVLKSILPRNTHGRISEIIKNVTNLIESDALKELLPESAFFKDLMDFPQEGIKYLSLGGTDPRLLTIYVWGREDKKVQPRALLSLPDSLLKILPNFMIMDEITLGKGDGLVSAKSSVLPWASKHHNLPVNHLSILWNKKATGVMIEMLKEV